MGRPSSALPGRAHRSLRRGLVSREPTAGVSEIAKDTTNFTSRNVVIGNGRPTELDLPAPIGVAPPITSDPPFHAIARRLILPAFAPGPINALEPMIRELCSKLLDTMAGEDVVNAGTQYAQYIPPSVIRGMLGFPEEDIEQFLEFVHIILEGIDHPEEERIIEFEPVEKYFVAQIEEHMDSPRDDLTSYLLNAELDGQNLALEHVFGTMVLILVAGIDTTWSAIGSAIWHLAHNPRTWRGWSTSPISCPSQSKSSSASTLRSPWHDWSSMTWSTRAVR